MRLKPFIAIAATIVALTAGITNAQTLQPTAEQQQRHLELFRKGSVLWPIYCNHCHDARNAAEFAPYQWDQIMMHMRTMENMPLEDAEAILEYLKTAR
jgi:hypothetical protein